MSKPDLIHDQLFPLPSPDPIRYDFSYPTVANDTKVYNPQLPFSRINYPHFGEKGPKGEDRLGGTGAACGCNNSDDYPGGEGLGGVAAAIVARLRDVMRAIPGWVPAMTDIGRPDEEREAQGVLVRSFQTWTDVPLRQWHCYYDWNFHIDPEKGFDFCRGQANVSAAHIEDKEVAELHDSKVTKKKHEFEAVVKGENMECEWDCGSFGRRPGAMFWSHWQWPMTGELVWIVGRPIYDCGHPGDKQDDLRTFNRTRSELHPVKGFASAKWEAEKFPENGDRFTPAVKFSFFACRKGGYFDFETLNDRDYEFIVDLPAIEPLRGPFPIGHTPDFPKNTIEVMPRLLAKIDYSQFQEALNQTPNAKEEPLPVFGTVAPIIAPGDDFDPAAPQAKIKIPLTSLSTRVEAYGVTISLGWYDPDSSTAKRVKKVTVSFLNIRTGSGVHTEDDLVPVDPDPESTDRALEEHWFVKLAVNGRWFWVDSADGPIGVQQNIPLERMSHTFWLASDDLIRISVHGAEVNSVDGMMQRDVKDRWLTFQRFPWVDGDRVDYIKDVQNGGISGPPTAGNKQSRLPTQKMIFREFIWKMAPYRDQSSPLGILDQTIKVSDLPEGDSTHQFQALYTSEVGTSAELAQTRDIVDYAITARFTVASQP